MRNKSLSILVKDAHELALRSEKATPIMEVLFDGAPEDDDGRKFAQDCQSVSVMLRELNIGRAHKTPAGRRSAQ